MHPRYNINIAYNVNIKSVKFKIQQDLGWGVLLA